jgi:natural product precursor
MKNRKLSLKKETVASLDKSDMANVKGGFTYSLSTGRTCQYSKSLGAVDAYQCGSYAVTPPASE